MVVSMATVTLAVPEPSGWKGISWRISRAERSRANTASAGHSGRGTL
jgi:hypothetical protein